MSLFSQDQVIWTGCRQLAAVPDQDPLSCRRVPPSLLPVISRLCCATIVHSDASTRQSFRPPRIDESLHTFTLFFEWWEFFGWPGRRQWKVKRDAEELRTLRLLHFIEKVSSPSSFIPNIFDFELLIARLLSTHVSRPVSSELPSGSIALAVCLRDFHVNFNTNSRDLVSRSTFNIQAIRIHGRLASSSEWHLGDNPP